MAALRCYSNWDKRPADLQDQVEPYRKYIFICEGENTEKWYFTRIIDMKKELGIHPMIDIRLLEKPEAEKSASNPKNLLEFAERLKLDLGADYDNRHDKMVLVFDLDIYQGHAKEYEQLLESGKEYIFAVTNPGFELFLLLHYENSYHEWIEPNSESILSVRKVSQNHSFVSKLFSDCSGMNPKKCEKIGFLADKVEIAILQEKYLNQDIKSALSGLTSNVGKVIQEIRDDKG